MPDEQHQVTVAFENHDFALPPSPGEVVLPLYGRKIHHDPRCGHLTDGDALPRFPDPDRLLWRRLIDSAPSHDTAGSTAFTRSIDGPQAFVYAHAPARQPSGGPPTCVLIHPGSVSATRGNIAVRRWDGSMSARVRSVSLHLPSVLGALGDAERDSTLAKVWAAVLA
ncbi:hypothetical protein ACFXPN_08890 [Streptomyces griseorubiginosus]|uniref:hypothetical protein n=1 Tax=Streptomyces griseorubiginosus TaxID=67304 RepID=UPI0036C469B4